MAEFRELKEIDLKLKLLSGDSIRVGGTSVKPYLLKEIMSYGYTNYMNNVQLISASIDDFINSIDDNNKRLILEKQKDRLKTFDFFIKLGGKDIFNRLINSIAMIFRTDDVVILDDYIGTQNVIGINFFNYGVIDINGDDVKINMDLAKSPDVDIAIIDRNNFDDIVEVIKLQNYLAKPDRDEQLEENPADEETRKLMEHMKAMREKVEKAKKKQQNQDNNEDIDISDIIGAICSKSNSINELNVWDLTIYQLYMKYGRLELIDSYDFGIKAIMAGAEKIDLKHWSSKI